MMVNKEQNAHLVKRIAELEAEVIVIDRALKDMGEKVVNEANRREKAEDELEWYRTLKIVRQDDDITRIDGGEIAQLLHEMWEENISLKAELEKKRTSS